MSKLIEKIIPGYGYRVQKDRLNSDRAVRDKLSRELKKSYSTLIEVSDLAYKDGRRDVLEPIKDLRSTIDFFRNEIENASYGLSPLFKEDKVSDDAPDAALSGYKEALSIFKTALGYFDKSLQIESNSDREDNRNDCLDYMEWCRASIQGVRSKMRSAR